MSIQQAAHGLRCSAGTVFYGNFLGECLGDFLGSVQRALFAESNFHWGNVRQNIQGELSGVHVWIKSLRVAVVIRDTGVNTHTDTQAAVHCRHKLTSSQRSLLCKMVTNEEDDGCQVTGYVG